MTRVGVIGAGRVGSVLGARLRAAGWDVPAVTARSEASLQRVEALLPGVPVADVAGVVAVSDVLLLTVPDDVLSVVATDLAAQVRPGTLVVHTSGRFGRAVLEPVEGAGARTAAAHPAMTFTGTERDLDRPCRFGVTVDEADRVAVEDLIRAAGGTPWLVAEADRITYHAALAHGSNHLVTLVGQACDLLRAAGSDEPAEVLAPLLRAALENSLELGDAALTGPVARGDVDAVQAHLTALDEHPQIAHTYRALALATAERSGRDELDDLLNREVA